eukprot:TRINITY_DN23159_c0_g1_i1.p1 TRINITY_DN23159_c0_g1~~TRINITY_DN23159_c0_g1_i1.p1  ORF type:complete len:219 (+),score=58.09 TRINITY_DN23159_c0_g1_i1:320-976(+)
MPKKPAAKAAGKKKRGLTEEEKLQRSLDFFHEHPEPYTMKDLIRILPKEKGIVFNTVEATVRMLVAEGKVQQDKVGVSTLMWSFPSDTMVKLESQKAAIEKQLSDLSEKNENTRKRIREIEEACSESANRSQLIQSLAALREQDTRLTEELEQSKLVDPAYLTKISGDARWFIKHANLWTDNIYLLLRHASQQHGMPRKELMQAVGVSDTDLIYCGKQ